MLCPKCGQQNPDNTQSCAACGSTLTQAPTPSETVHIRTSRLAIASSVLATLGLFGLFLPTPLPITNALLDLTSVAAIGVALLLGITGLIRIATSAGKLAGRGFAIVGIVIPLIVFCGIFGLALIQFRNIARRLPCGSNLSAIGKAMLTYAQDYDDQFPRAGGPNTTWQPKIKNWKAHNRREAFNMDPDGTGGQASISSSFYLLAKHVQVAPKHFVCKGDPRTTWFNPGKYDAGDRQLVDSWDFGPEPTKHCSHTYHLPYSPYAINTSSEGGAAVAADRNPFIDSPGAKAVTIADFDPDGPRGQQELGNSPSHKRQGQNVLYAGIHVSFEKRSYCGIDEDNIYTSWAGPDKRRGAAPTLTSQPADRRDSLLVHDPPAANDHAQE